MLYQFDTDSVEHAKAALLLYAMYRSRKPQSSLNGPDTWERCNSYCRGAWLKSRTTAQFVQNFCRKADIGSIRPRYLSTGEPVLMKDTGELVMSGSVSDYRISLLEDNSILPLFGNETIYIIMLVRERIQREKMMGTEEEDADENSI